MNHISEMTRLEIAPSGNALLRALEFSGLRRELPLSFDSPKIVSALREGPNALCALFASQRDCSSRLVHLSGRELKNLALEGRWLLFPRAGGWTVIRNRRVFRVDESGLESHSLRVAKALEAAAQHPGAWALVLEFDLGLEALSVRSLGSSSPWHRLWALVGLEARELRTLAVYSVVLGALSLAVPTAVQVLVNTIALASLTQPLIVLVLLLFSVMTLSAGVYLMRAYAAELLQRRIFVRVAEDFCERIPDFIPSKIAHLDLRERCNRFFEVITLQKSVAHLVVDGLGLVLQTMVGLLLLAFYHPLLLAFDAVLVVAVLLVFAAGRGAVKSALEESNSKYKVAAWVHELASQRETLQQGQFSRGVQEHSHGLIVDYLQARKTHFRRLFRQLLGSSMLQVFAMVSLLALGGHLVMQGELTLGQLVAAELVVGTIVSGFAKLGKHLEKLYDLLAGLDKLGKVVDLPVRPVGSRPDKTNKCELELPQQLIADGRWCVSKTRMAPGQTLAIRGGDFDGQQELFALLGGHSEVKDTTAVCAYSLQNDRPQRMDSVELAQCSVTLSKLQRSWLMLSVIERFRLIRPEMTRVELLDHLETVGLDGKIVDKAALDFTVSEFGARLSPMQSLRFLTATICLIDPLLLIVDNGQLLGELVESEKQELAGLWKTKLAETIIVGSPLWVEFLSPAGSIDLAPESRSGTWPPKPTPQTSYRS